jgi:hypothetical protein
MSLRDRINAKCKGCIFDHTAPGTWRQQVALCSVKSCELHDVRPKPTRPIPESILRWYGVKLAEFEALESIPEGGASHE